MGIVGLGNSWGAVAQLLIRGTPLFNRDISHVFLRVGLCSHMVLPFAGDVDARRTLDSVGTAEIAWPESTRSSNLARAQIIIQVTMIGGLTDRHMAT